MKQGKKIRAGIIGGAGYTGGEMIRLLVEQPDRGVRCIHSRSNAGKPVASIHQDLVGETELEFTAEYSNDIDVLFLCLGHGESKKFLGSTKIADSVRIIDIANDFRLTKDAKQKKREFVYGLQIGRAHV